MKLLLLSLSLSFSTVVQSFAFVKQPTGTRIAASNSHRTTLRSAELPTLPRLFEEDEEMIPVAENYIRAKYRQVASSSGHQMADADDIKSVLHEILPPVTSQELEREESEILEYLLCKSEELCIDELGEDDFVRGIINNSYWRTAGDIVVKELMYFDSLHAYYTTGKALLGNSDYDDLHENLTWEGSSIATMSASEVKFVSAVAAAKRGQPTMDDAEYGELKSALRAEGSWVVNRGSDALERLGLSTFLGYLHRAL